MTTNLFCVGDYVAAAVLARLWKFACVINPNFNANNNDNHISANALPNTDSNKSQNYCRHKF